ncbi:type VII secretion protein EccE [Nocardia uniformis]|uniref:Type VII secretion protein EccE n=1 Tax=Nocardia uniformis TaxID=53432 RepID=A0A849C681_9NOCA|nr:type VII secretion protein EccE [Nocardia uniformis]NNH73226.1 type VII secretion protein EccE [Nocardia uniformis]
MTVSFPRTVPVPTAARLPFATEAGPLAGALIGGSLILPVLIATTPWWVVVLVSALWAGAVLVPVRGRTACGWLRDRLAYRAGRIRHADELTRAQPVVDVEVAAGVCGIRLGDTTLVAMIQLAPNLDLPTIIGANTTYTEDIVPVDLLATMLDQYGLALDIDIVTTGQRVRSAGSYGALYDQLIGNNPAIGDRLTWLVLRLDVERNLELLARRGPAASVAPKALATAALRIASRFRELEITAQVLPAEAVREATRLLHTGFELTDLRETWAHLEGVVSARCVTSYEIDLAGIDQETLDTCWMWHTGRITLTVSLSTRPGEHGAGPMAPGVELRALVRYVGTPQVDPPAHLHPLTGRQQLALLASLPLAVRDHLGRIQPPRGVQPVRHTAGSPDSVVPQLSLPIGPSGQILGAISGRAEHHLALPLFDPVRYSPRRRTIDVHAHLSTAQQLVLRTIAVGADVEIHTSRPQQWQPLIDAVGDPRSVRLAAGHGPIEGSSHAEPARVAVFDHRTPTVTAAQATIVIGAPGGPRQRSADLAIDQVSETTVDVSIPMHTVRLDLIEPVGEQRYLAGASNTGTSNNGAPSAGAPNDMSPRGQPAAVPALIGARPESGIAER